MPRILRKLNARGKHQVWRATIDDGPIATVTIDWGQEGGKHQQKIRTYESGKQGRTALQQAHFEVNSDVKRKIREGYEELEEIPQRGTPAPVPDTNPLPEPNPTPNPDSPLESDSPPESAAAITPKCKSRKKRNSNTPSPLPMLAHTLNRHTLPPIVYCQPKLDGIRCMANRVTGELWSRRRTPIPGLGHIIAAIKNLPWDSSAPTWLDGELYVHNMNFEEITSLVRKPSSKSKIIQYHVYDCVTDAPFEDRWKWVLTLNQGMVPTPLRIVPTCQIESSYLDEKHGTIVADGYEGTIIRLNGTTYEEGKRSNNLLKKKDFLQEEFRCVGFQEEDNAPGTVGSVQLVTKTGQGFSARPAMTSAQRTAMWTNQRDYLSKIATVKFFELTKNGIPRFPVLLGFRHEDDT